MYKYTHQAPSQVHKSQGQNTSIFSYRHAMAAMTWVMVINPIDIYTLYSHTHPPPSQGYKGQNT